MAEDLFAELRDKLSFGYDHVSGDLAIRKCDVERWIEKWKSQVQQWREKAEKWDEFLKNNKSITGEHALWEIEQYYSRKYLEMEAGLRNQIERADKLESRLEAVKTLIEKGPHFSMVTQSPDSGYDDLVKLKEVITYLDELRAAAEG